MNFVLTMSVLAVATMTSTARAADSVTLVDFVSGGNLTWVAENDPVMGGVSDSNFTLHDDILSWQGECKIVPSLQAPGFCIVQSYGKHGFLEDVSAMTHLTLRVKTRSPYSGFKVNLPCPAPSSSVGPGADLVLQVDFSSAKHPNTQFTSFKADFPADFKASGDWQDVAIPFTNFTWDWSSYTGEPVTTCAEDSSKCPTALDLKTLMQIGIWAEGVEGAFELDVESVGAATM